MASDPNRILIDSLKRLLRRDAVRHLRKILMKTHGADLARALRALPLAEQHQLFALIDDLDKKGTVICELDEDALRAFVARYDLEKLVPILEEMATDDVADVLGRLPDETSDALLSMMKHEGSEEVEGLLGYDDDTAGGIMVTDVVAVPESITARQAIELLQRDYADAEMPFYLYVVDDNNKLVGVSSLRQLVLVPPNTLIKSFMSADVISVRTSTDQEEVAKLVARYDILAVPVVDETNALAGIVTVDDVIDIFRREATEDILKMAGAGEAFVETQSVLRSTRIRLPWLFASCIGGVVALMIIGSFEASLREVAYLAAFIPVITGMGGNIGTQSSTIIVRGLATGFFELHDIGKVAAKELAIGGILGLFYGIVIAGVAQIRYSAMTFSIAVAAAVICSMTAAALIGSLVPMTLARLRIDPAVATGPFVTTTIDVISVFSYFAIATTLLGV